MVGIMELLKAAQGGAAISNLANRFGLSVAQTERAVARRAQFEFEAGKIHRGSRDMQPRHRGGHHSVAQLGDLLHGARHATSITFQRDAVTATLELAEQ